MPAEGAPGSRELVRIRGLSKRYVRRGGLWRGSGVVPALDRVDLTLSAGSTLALVGPSGAGKSTLARCLARLEEPDAGEIRFDGRDILNVPCRDLRALRRQIQIIFQDPVRALSPRLTAVDIVAEPLLMARREVRSKRREIALALLEQVGLRAEWGKRRPLELSGGQRQRLAIARALATEPKLLILDEPLAGIDVSVQGQVVNLLLELQASLRLTYLYVSHDVGLMGRIADEIAVLYEGSIVEQARVQDIFGNPRHPFTRALVSSMPGPSTLQTTTPAA